MNCNFGNSKFILNDNLQIIWNNTFNKGIVFSNTNPSTFKIPASVTTIKTYAFAYLTNTSNVTLQFGDRQNPSQLKSLASDAFIVNSAMGQNYSSIYFYYYPTESWDYDKVLSLISSIPCATANIHIIDVTQPESSLED